MINPINNINLYQPKEITIKTAPYKSFDEGMPFEATQVTIEEKQENGENKVWSQYLMTGNTETELNKITDTLKEIYTQDAYKPSQPEDIGTPTPGKDFYV